MKPDSDKLIEQLVSNTRSLLEDHWGKAENVFANTNIKITMTHLIDFDAADPVASTTIAFGARVKDKIESIVRDEAEELPMDVEETPRRGRPRKVV